MGKKYTDEEVNAMKVKPIKKRYTDEEVTSMKYQEPEKEGFFSELGRSALDSLPELGMMAGGTMGGVAGGIGGLGMGTVPGRLAGAALGGYTGEAIKNAYNRYAHPQNAPTEELDYITRPIKKARDAVILEGAATGIQKLMPYMGQLFVDQTGGPLKRGAVPDLPKNPVKDWIANKTNEGAERLAFRALKPFKRQVSINRDKIREVGRTALDEKVIGGIPTSSEGLQIRAEEALERSGARLKTIVDELERLESEAISSGVSREALAAELEKRLIKDSDISIIQKRNGYFQDLIDQFKQGKKLNFKKIRKDKIDVGDNINWNRLPNADIPEEEQFLRALYFTLREAEENGAAAIEKAFTNGEGKAFKDAKTNYHHLEIASGIAGNSADAQRANQILGLKSSVAGAGGTAAGAIVKGTAAGAVTWGLIAQMLNHLAKNYGSQVSASVLNKLTILLKNSPSMQEKALKNPNFLPFLLKSLEDKEKKK